MKITYDPQYNIAYIGFNERDTEVETIQLSDQVNVDISPDGTLYGIELLNAKEQLFGNNGGLFEFVNEALNKTDSLTLSQ